MKHNIFLFLFFLLLSPMGYAQCENHKLSIKVFISSQSLDTAYNNGAVFFSGADHIEVIEKSTNRSHVFKNATLHDDQAGQFKLVAPSSFNPKIVFTHDHETSYFEGLFGNFKGEDIIYDLSGLKCHWNELFEVI
ncbi:MAG: hypothetical protein MK008_12595 [Bdellovibrionales bacterium]|nr:hypothetical protein [Bdellovibrionales bacterium]